MGTPRAVQTGDVVAFDVDSGDAAADELVFFCGFYNHIQIPENGFFRSRDDCGKVLKGSVLRQIFTDVSDLLHIEIFSGVVVSHSAVDLSVDQTSGTDESAFGNIRTLSDIGDDSVFNTYCVSFSVQHIECAVFIIHGLLLRR